MSNICNCKLCISVFYIFLSFLGTLLRVCAASGCESFISSTSCADVWDPKVLRCAAGGHFHFPIYYRLSWEEIKKLLENKRVFLADNNTYGK